MKEIYPLGENMPERLRTPSGVPFEAITLDAVLEGRIGMQDLRVTPEALELQAQVAEEAGRRQLAENLRRAAELAGVPDDAILKVYAALRPGRATRAELLDMAEGMESKWHAVRCAALLREAAEAVAKPFNAESEGRHADSRGRRA